MSIARRLRWYLDASGLPYELLPHDPTSTSLATARAARIAPDRLLKPVLLEDDRGYVLAVLPASSRVDLPRLSEQMHRELELASEGEINALFTDCDRGALPPIGAPYRVPTVYDDTIAAVPDVFFEAGDHTDVVHMRAPDFLRLLAGALHGSFGQRSFDLPVLARYVLPGASGSS